MRPIGSLQIQVSRPWSLAAGGSLDELCPSARAILARLSAFPNESPSAVVPLIHLRLIGLERLANRDAPVHAKPLPLAHAHSAL